MKAEEVCAAVRATVRVCVCKRKRAFEKGGKKEGGRKILQERRRRRKGEGRRKAWSVGRALLGKKKKKMKKWAGLEVSGKRK